tara:strand:- start:136 stop:414 length:279 start_codon:yes stop_codon:yes gene_type:complete
MVADQSQAPAETLACSTAARTRVHSKLLTLTKTLASPALTQLVAAKVATTMVRLFRRFCAKMKAEEAGMVREQLVTTLRLDAVMAVPLMDKK